MDHAEADSRDPLLPTLALLVSLAAGVLISAALLLFASAHSAPRFAPLSIPDDQSIAAMARAAPPP